MIVNLALRSEPTPTPSSASSQSVTPLELFFDLVFVFTITQLTSLLAKDPTLTGLVQTVLIFGNVWWMYGGYAWLTNAVPPRELGVRLLLLVGMGGFLVVALAIPTAFAGGGLAFGLGYLVVTLVHTGVFLRTTQQSAVKAVLALGPFNLTTAGLLVVAGLVSGPARWLLFGAGFVLHWFTPVFARPSGFQVRSAHFVERHGLILLIAIGESVVAVGIGLGTIALPAGRIATALLGLALAAGLWWLYFNGEAEAAERSMERAPFAERAWLALNAFGYVFLLILGGIVLVAAGMKLAVVRYNEAETLATAVFLAGGVAAYAIGLGLFRGVLHTGWLGVRLGIGILALPTIWLGLAFTPVIQISALVLILVVGSILDAMTGRRSALV
jgi:low temperature requirement protein LtrA